ncbi:hypothetical protein LCGC14_2836830, partial [marine sediment metagenome]
PYRFIPWVTQIARNAARNMARRRHRPRLGPAVAVDSGLSEDLAEKVAHAIDALASLSPPLRETARLSYLSGHKQYEVAKRLGIPLGTVKSRLANSRRQIRERMDAMSHSDCSRVVPSVEIRDRPGETMRVPLRGQGMVFASVLEVGEVEVMGFYDYPGGVLTGITRTEVRRMLDLCGHRCYEVLNVSSECEPPEPVELDYFEVRDDGIQWLLRVRGGESFPDVYPDVVTEPITPPYYDTAQPSPTCQMRVVDLRVGDTDRGRCLAVLEWDRDGTAAEMFYQADGRNVLHRRYVGPAARYGDYEHLPADDIRTINDQPYRHWYDTVLFEPSGSVSCSES